LVEGAKAMRERLFAHAQSTFPIRAHIEQPRARSSFGRVWLP
jgi:hypothetical protein